MPSSTMEYRVKKNETYGSIAYKLYSNSLSYRGLMDAQEFPLLEIKEGQVLNIPDIEEGRDSAPVLTHPEISMNSRGGGSLNSSKLLTDGDNISPWTDTNNYLNRRSSLPYNPDLFSELYG